MSNQKILLLITLVCGLPVVGYLVWLFFPYFSPFRDSLPGRETGAGLPSVTIEKGKTVYCRMRADDFRFPLPAGARPRPAVIERGGFDTVHGTLEVELSGASEAVARQYADSVRRSVAMGGYLSAAYIPGGLRIRFEYFGDG